METLFELLQEIMECEYIYYNVLYVRQAYIYIPYNTIRYDYLSIY